MTRQRLDQHSTEFGLWLREQQPIDSRLGFVATNVDYLWRNYKTGEWMLIEEKRYGAKINYSQAECFLLLDRACRGASGYRGFHKLIFENTSPNDGRIWLDDKEVTQRQLINFLKFEKIDIRDEQMNRRPEVGF